MKGIYDAILQKTQADYLNRMLPKREGALAALEDHAQKNGVPIVDPEVGIFLDQITRLINAKRILEAGTATGFSTIYMARALAKDGKVLTIDIDPKRLELAQENFRAAGVADRIECIQGPALSMISKVEGPFDLIFLDAIKEEYRGYVELALPKLRIGGVLICDNLLWSGQVAGEIVKADERESTLALREFNPWFVQHPQLLAQILPLGDGTGFAIKIR